MEIFDPERETFSLVGDMNAPRLVPAAELLRNGRVLLEGSFTAFPFSIGNEAELYDPASNSFIPVDTPFFHNQADQYVVRLLDGTVLFPVGVNEAMQIVTTAYLYEPENNSFQVTDSVLFPRKSCKTVLLPDGRAILIGGFDFRKIVGVGEIYTPSIASQAAGLRNVIVDTPFTAFRVGVLKFMMHLWARIASFFIEEENYEQAAAVIEKFQVSSVEV